MYDLKNLDLYWTAIKNDNQRRIDLTRLDFSSSQKTVSMDIQSAGTGDVTADFGEKASEKSSSGCNLGIPSLSLILLTTPLVLLKRR
ncbi:Synerg-CTERM sorting domain-containing protein [Dethiosulfovibrio salsuginis]|uniref:Synergist-CTERM protein sorting domain-containing protein n=1 Tax=Dethiosulfovibrio salsuginis TaxID=561720 RepID=A0A1X7J3B7_9BACT|nr:Synerg-CTERM sorting domain-containing protein [Dethiosulfovibrio salsuginis]SMG22101.1 Synergist-CTERM protein sorting domain-containing protein [Dethiosulfovibrio salsuginis]